MLCKTGWLVPKPVRPDTEHLEARKVSQRGTAGDGRPLRSGDCEAVTVGEAGTGVFSAKANSLNGRLISERPASGAVVAVFEK
jgi:hypothetical protein